MSTHPLIREIENSFRRDNLPDFRPGDSVRVHTLIKEGDKERVQVFEGVVIDRRSGSALASFTVRKISYGVGVERVFPLHSSRIEKIEVVQRGRVRRARLNYLRKLQGKAARIKGQRGQLAGAETTAAESHRPGPGRPRDSRRVGAVHESPLLVRAERVLDVDQLWRRCRRARRSLPPRRSETPTALGCSSSMYILAARRTRARLRASIVSSGWPRSIPVRERTSTKTHRPSLPTTRSSSPSGRRQLRAMMV